MNDGRRGGELFILFGRREMKEGGNERKMKEYGMQKDM
jgi:hypothetical protein